jgi:ribonuclease VapC
MILDTSALVAVLFGEPEADTLLAAIYNATTRRLSAANFVELSIVIAAQASPEMSDLCAEFLRRAEVIIEPVTVEQAYLARQAFLEYGKGRNPAKLNFGDCFAYALAKTTGEELLFKGNDFSLTDLVIST